MSSLVTSANSECDMLQLLTSAILAVKDSITPGLHGDALAVNAVELRVIASIEVENGGHLPSPKAGIVVDEPFLLAERVVRGVGGGVGLVRAVQGYLPGAPVVQAHDRVLVAAEHEKVALRLPGPAVLCVKQGSSAQSWSNSNSTVVLRACAVIIIMMMRWQPLNVMTGARSSWQKPQASLEQLSSFQAPRSAQTTPQFSSVFPLGSPRYQGWYPPGGSFVLPVASLNVPSLGWSHHPLQY